MRLTDKSVVDGLMAALLSEGFTVKLYAYRCHDGNMKNFTTDKREWNGGVAYEIYVTGLENLTTLFRLQPIMEKFGLQAWLNNDEDGQSGMKLEIDFGRERT